MFTPFPFLSCIQDRYKINMYTEPKPSANAKMWWICKQQDICTEGKNTFEMSLLVKRKQHCLFYFYKIGVYLHITRGPTDPEAIELVLSVNFQLKWIQINFSGKGISSRGLHILGPLCLWQCAHWQLKLSLFYVSARLSTNFAAHDMEMPNKTNTGSVGDIITMSSDFHPVRALNWKGSI